MSAAIAGGSKHVSLHALSFRVTLLVCERVVPNGALVIRMGDAATIRLSYEQLRETLKRFEYFRHWTEEQIRECSVLARVVQYAPHQTIPLDQPLPLTYLVLSGQCMILQCLEFLRNELLSSTPRETPAPRAAQEDAELDQVRRWHETFRAQFAKRDVDETSQEVPCMRSDQDATVCFLKVIAAASVRENVLRFLTSRTRSPNQTPPPEQCVRHQFVDVGTLGCGAVFGLGERHHHRTIVARTSTQCLLIPRCWLFLKRQNIGNTWPRLCMYLDWAVPSRDELFQGFLSDRRWLRYRRRLIGLTDKRRSGTVPADVPIMCRIAETTSAGLPSSKELGVEKRKKG
uniref:Cyclic nucleotide-binding domain-containing protein n=1 Tax=Anopheles farauti TaxID=69004 RepID=A0A182QLX4_9DIPT